MTSPKNSHSELEAQLRTTQQRLAELENELSLLKEEGTGNTDTKTSPMPTRRAALVGVLGTLAGSAALLSSSKARAQAGLSETALLAKLLSDTKTLIDAVKQNYELARGYVDRYNQMAGEINNGLRTFQDVATKIKDFYVGNSPLEKQKEQLAEWFNRWRLPRNEPYRFRVPKFNLDSQALIEFTRRTYSDLDRFQKDFASLAPGSNKSRSEVQRKEFSERVAFSKAYTNSTLGQVYTKELAQRKTDLYDKVSLAARERKKDFGELLRSQSADLEIEIALQSLRTLQNIEALLVRQLGRNFDYVPAANPDEKIVGSNELGESLEKMKDGLEFNV